jgi:polysaccharide export outer membrane protein
MTRFPYYMILSLMLCAEPVVVNAGSSSGSSVSSERSMADSPSPSLFVTSSEKGLDFAVKDCASTTDGLSTVSHAQILGKLSNTVSSDYIIGAEDVLEITVWRNQDLSKVVQVRPDGRFSLPVIRDVVAVGKTTSQLADELTKKLKEYVQNPMVAISARDVNSYNIFLLGEVVRPGKYPLKSKTTLLQGITIAGGFTPIAARNQVVIFRFKDNEPGTQTLTASYDDIVLRGGIAQNLELQAGDTVVVPSESMVIFPGR